MIIWNCYQAIHMAGYLGIYSCYLMVLQNFVQWNRKLDNLIKLTLISLFLCWLRKNLTSFKLQTKLLLDVASIAGMVCSPAFAPAADSWHLDCKLRLKTFLSLGCAWVTEWLPTLHGTLLIKNLPWFPIPLGTV